jgi:nitroreductase
MSVIFKRRSIRKYKDKVLPEEVIEKLLRAGMAAPSAGNAQPWHFIVIDDKNLLDEIPNFHPSSKMLKEVSHAIVVCGDLSLEKARGYWIQDCSAATQNILLMATELGLGSVWLGVHPIEERVNGVRKLLQIPEGIIPLSIIAVGYADESKEPVDRYNVERIHNNKW